MAGTSVPMVAEKDFEREVLRSDKPVLVDFTSDRCQPCKVVAPEVEALMRDLDGKAKVVKIDIDHSRRIAGALRIQAVPTFMVFVQGRPVAAEQGVMKKRQLREMLEPFLPRAEGAVNAQELAKLLKEQQVVAVDTRDASAWNRTRIPGAVHMPYEEVEQRLAELHMLPGAPVLYCRAGDKTKELAEKLAEAGVPVAFLEGGILGWEAEFLPVERPN